MNFQVIFLTIILIVVPLAVFMAIGNPRIWDRALGGMMILASLWAVIVISKSNDSAQVLGLTMSAGGAALWGIPNLIAPGSPISSWCAGFGAILIVIGSVVERNRRASRQSLP